jgi:hypothetical protein
VNRACVRGRIAHVGLALRAGSEILSDATSRSSSRRQLADVPKARRLVAHARRLRVVDVTGVRAFATSEQSFRQRDACRLTPAPHAGHRDVLTALRAADLGKARGRCGS